MKVKTLITAYCLLFNLTLYSNPIDVSGEKDNMSTNKDIPIEAKVSFKNGNIMRGETFTAEIFLYPYSPDMGTIKKVVVNGIELKVNENGIATYIDELTIAGTKTASGYIDFEPKEGNTERIKINPFSYNVHFPYSSVTPTKMNVLYLGVDNPIDISVAGVPAHNLIVTTSNCTIDVLGYGNYILNPSSPGLSILDIKDKKGTNYGEFTFRNKYIPSPYATCGGKISGSYSSEEFKKQQGILLILDNFDFDVPFRTYSYEAIVINEAGTKNSFVINGPSFPQELLSMVKNCKKGDIFIFQKIKIEAPDGGMRQIPGISYTIE